MNAFLQGLSGEMEGCKIDLSSEDCIIGREKGNQIYLRDVSASSKHCVIHTLSDGLFVRDLNSTNGTFLNGEPIEEAPMHHGDILQIGAVKFQVDCPEATPQKKKSILKFGTSKAFGFNALPDWVFIFLRLLLLGVLAYALWHYISRIWL